MNQVLIEGMCVCKHIPDTKYANHFPVQSPSWPAGDLQTLQETQVGRGRRKGWQHQVESDSIAPLDTQKQKSSRYFFFKQKNEKWKKLNFGLKSLQCKDIQSMHIEKLIEIHNQTFHPFKVKYKH